MQTRSEQDFSRREPTALAAGIGGLSIRESASGLMPRPVRRCGVTLIELLIVMGIMTVLATLSLTTVKGLLKGQKVTQAARLVEQYIESARLRAVTNGRPVAVFLERVAVTGDTAGDPIYQNFFATRLSIGEVFPPYRGDVLSATGTLWDVDMSMNSTQQNGPANVVARSADGFADQVRFTPGDVLSAFGTPSIPGMMAVGDTIEFEGTVGRFPIERIDWVSDGGTGSHVAVTFFNPPAPLVYNSSLKAQNIRPPRTLMPAYSTQEPRLPLPPPPGVPALEGVTDATPTGAPPSVGFRIYRRPTKSLVGAITLPRGTCVDFAASGFGSTSAGGGDSTSPFWLGSAPSTAAVSRSSYSRIGILFNAEGRLASVMVENNFGGTRAYTATDADQILHLLVGRTDQVIPGSLDTEQNRKLAMLLKSPPTDSDPLLSNLLDPGNTWITCNPFTGEIRSAPVSEVSDDTTFPSGDTLPVVRAKVANDPTQSIAEVVQAARALATAGVNE